MENLARLLQLIAGVGAVALLANGAYAMWKQEKGINQQLIISLVALGLALTVALEIVSGGTGLISAVYGALAAIVKTVASSFAG